LAQDFNSKDQVTAKYNSRTRMSCYFSLAHILRPFTVSRASGDPIVLQEPLDGDDRVWELRRQVAAVLKHDPGKVALLLEDEELVVHKTLLEALGYSDEEVAIKAVKLPCRIRPAHYDAYIDRDAVGFMQVEEIRATMGDRLVLFPNGQPPDGFRIPPESRIRGWLDPQRERQRRQRIEMEGWVWFPEPRDININMMPFIIGKKESIPAEYWQYWDMIESCKIPNSENGKVGYLTIQESLVPAGQTQRRSGLHIESPGSFNEPGTYTNRRYDWGCGSVLSYRSSVSGGLYLATNLLESCCLWNVQIKDTPSSAGELGDMEHMRDLLGEGEYMEPERLYWLTDATPHESLPCPTEEYRQFFRLVTSSLSAWYPEHCTANPIVTPDPAVTEVVLGSKFKFASNAEEPTVPSPVPPPIGQAPEEGIYYPGDDVIYAGETKRCAGKELLYGTCGTVVDVSAGTVRVRFAGGFGTVSCSREDLGLEARKGPMQFLVDNSMLMANALGLGYRNSKTLDDVSSNGDIAQWGSRVHGVDLGDGWLQVGNRFLPMTVNGKTVLRLMQLA